MPGTATRVALAGVRAGLNLLLEGQYDRSELDSAFHGCGRISVEAWEGHPEDTDGVAVWGPDEPTAIARIPLCGCGYRGCGNAGRQFEGFVDPMRITEIIDLLRRLPWASAAPRWDQAMSKPDIGKLFGDALRVPA